MSLLQTYPGAPGFPEPHQSGYAYNSPVPYNAAPQGGGASSYYDGYAGSAHSQAGPQAVRYDEHGNPIPEGAEGERGLGTMAMGAIGGVAANKMSGGHHSTLASGAGGAMLAQGAKMAFEMFNKKNNKPYAGGTHGQYGHHGHHGHQSGGLFGKREL